jgi:hypothetical protein
MDKTYKNGLKVRYENLLIKMYFNIGIPFNIKINKHNLLPAFFGKQFSNQALQYGRFVYLTQKKITHPQKRNYCIEQLK